MGLPGDVAASPCAESPGASGPLPSHGIYRPLDGELRQLAEMIGSAERITVFCGIGAREAHDEVVRLAAMLKAPVAYTFKAKMEVQYDNPYEIGMTGLLGPSFGLRSHARIGPAAVAGHGFPLRLFSALGVPYRAGGHPSRAHRPPRPGQELGLAGDVKETLQALFPMLRERSDRVFLDRQLKIYGALCDDMAAVASKRGSAGNIAPEYVATLIDTLASDSAIFTVDTGMCCVWGARYLRATGRRRMLGSFNHGSMANALPMAIGAAFARPGQEVVALCGDGGLSMLLGDLATIVEYKLPVKIVVFDNRSLGMVKLEMEVSGLPDWQTDMCNPDFEFIARAMGIRGFTADSPDSVAEVLAEAFDTPGPVLVNVRTDPNALAMPPKVEFGQMKGFALAMTRLILSGRAGEVVATAKSNLKHLCELV